MAGIDFSVSRMTLAALCLALAACGGGDGDNDAPAPAPAPAPTPAPPSAPSPGIVKSVSLVAGGGSGATGSCGETDGIGSEARLGYLRDMAVANDGTVYVLETPCTGPWSSPQRVRSITESGQTATMATGFTGSLPPGELLHSFMLGSQLAVGDSGAVYLMDTIWDGVFLRPVYSPGMASGIWKITPTGAQAFAGIQSQGTADGQGLDAQFDSASNMVFSDGALIVTDYNLLTRKVTEDAVVTTVTLPYRPDMTDNAGGLYQRMGDWNSGQGILMRFDGYAVAAPGLMEAPLAISSDGTVYGTRKDADSPAYRLYRQKADGTAELIEGPDGGEASSWVSSSLTPVTRLKLDRAGHLYVGHGHQIWKVTFYD